MKNIDFGNYLYQLRKENVLVPYRVGNWMYDVDKCAVEFKDMEKVFPKWIEAWNNFDNENFEGKYKFFYMGFGNGLCVDREISDIFESHLKEIIDNPKDYSEVFNKWQEAVIQTAKDLNYEIDSNKEIIKEKK